MTRSTIMGLHGLKNKTSRNSFDLSHRNLFTAKVGELIPCCVQELNPGDSIKIDSSYFTRTAPLESAAFTRLRENIQFFFVPYKLLWKYFNTQVTNMTQNASGASVARVADSPLENQSVTTSMPYINFNTLNKYLNGLMLSMSKTSSETSSPLLFNNGEVRHCASAKLLNYLGYGCFNQQFHSYVPDNWFTHQTFKNAPNLSIFRLLAYQKICNDHYTFKQWQPYDARLCNIDYIKPSSSMALDDYLSDHNFRSKMNFLDLRFSNLPLDYFNGVLPTAQYGSESVVNLDLDTTSSLSTGQPMWSIGSSAYNSTTDPVKSGSLSVSSGAVKVDGTDVQVRTEHIHNIDASLNSIGELSVSSLRNALALQKYKEIQLASDPDFVSQVEAHFGIKPKHDDDTSIFIGGASSMIDINPQVNSNLTSDNQAEVKAAPTGQGSAHIKFTADTYGVVIGIYRCTPILDYAAIGIDRTLLKTDASDFVIPELDSIGMQQTFNCEVATPYGIDDQQSPTFAVNMSSTYGYAPRYAEYKTSFDRYRGAFVDSMSSWVTGLNVKDLYYKWLTTGWHAPDLFNCRPDLVSSIFLNTSTRTTNDDNLFVGLVNMVYATRNLSRFGLPYSN